MANAPNVELEAAKFLHKLIQESKDEPTKLATKLYVILQHMRSSGKENSMPYQVISRAMETVIKQHNLDIESLVSSRPPPVAGGAQVGDSASLQLAGNTSAGSSQRAGVANNVKADVSRPEAHASSMGQVGPSSGGQDIYRGSASHISGATKVHGAAPGASSSNPVVDSGIPNPMLFGSSSYDNPGFAPTLEKTVEAYSVTPPYELSASKSAGGKAVDHEGGSNMVENKVIQGGVVSNALESSVLKSVVPRDTGKSPASCVPFKEQQLRQLRAQCLVFLAFRNGLMPKKLHLEIALGNILPKDDGQRRELVDSKGKEQSVTDPNNGRTDIARETDRLPLGSSSVGILAETNVLKEAENTTVMDDRSGLPGGQFDNVEDGRHNLMTKNPDAEETTESQPYAPRGLQADSNARGLAVSYTRNALNNISQQNGTPNQASFSMGTGQARKDYVHNQSPAECNFQVSRFAESNMPNFQAREQWTPVPGMDGQNHLAVTMKDSATMMNNRSQVQESDPEEEDDSISTEKPPPKYTTVDKWIFDHQKRRYLIEQERAMKQQKTEQKIAACYDKLKDNVISSEDINAKTKSMIELKKLKLLELQRRLRRDIMDDFFKPATADLDRLKSTKKHRIGRKSKQLERYELRMKEERNKRFRERQKDFFSEIEVHRERLEDTFKVRRERWKGLNKFVREFHKRKERIHREKIDRIQREKINLLKVNDVEGYLRMVQDAKSDRVKQLLKETEKYLSKLGAKLQQAKVNTRRFETDMDESTSTGLGEKSEVAAEEEDDMDQAKHYLESNEKYYLMAHSIKESIMDQPATLVGGKLREYQMNGLRWLLSLYNNHLNGILADEMGLGKTVQVISLLCYLMENKNDRGPFLVVVPSSVLPGWESEIKFWAPSIHRIVYSGPPEERRRLFKEQIVHQKFNVLLTTYEYLMNKHDRPKLSKVHWHYIIIDEGHRIKNASCKLNADLKHYRSNHRLLLTGTPLQNNLEELWALLNFLLPDIFNSSEDFSQWFNKPFEGSVDTSAEQALLSEEENLLIINRLHQVLRPFVLRRLKHKVENELPEKIERLVRCEASSYQKLLMKRVEENLGAFGNSKARSVHNSVMELRNICNHPYLSQLHVEEVHDMIPKHYLPNVVRLCGKLEMLDRLLPKLKATDHRVLLFSTMTRLLDVLEDYLYWKQYKYLRLDGHTSGGDRGALIDNFNKPGSPFFIFLLSIRAGGVGVNLQAADTVIIFDTDWNPQVDLQAQARAHRIGQKKDVLVLRFETVQTVEEQVRASAEHKLGVANQSITAGFFDNNTSAEDRREYLETLLRECKKEEAAPVLDDDALNDLIARSESEIDIFESVDKKRREEEMAIWKQLDTENGTETSLLPPRLLTDDELKPFNEAMKKIDVPRPGQASTAGVKRKGDLGGLDMQHYGRGKRAREVRNYEEQLTEEEFERMCQVDASGSPIYADPIADIKLPTVTSGSDTGEKLERPVPQPHLQPTASQQNKEVTPPLKRGRGRPRRTVTPVARNIAPVAHTVTATDIPAPVALPAPVTLPAPVALPSPSAVSKIEPPGSLVENTSGSSVIHASDSKPTSTTPLRSITGNINPVGVQAAAPSPQSTPLPSVGPASQSAGLPTPVQGRGRGRKAQTGEAPKRRGRKQKPGLQDVPVTPVPSEIAKPELEKQVTVPSSSTASVPEPVSSSATPGNASKEPNAVVPPIPVLQSSSVIEKAIEGEQKESNLGSSVFSDPPPGFPSLISTVKEDHGIKTTTASETAPDSQVVVTSQSEPKQGKGRGRGGRKAQVVGETPPRRRGKRQASETQTPPVVPSGSADQDLKSVEPPPPKRSRVTAGRRVSARNKQEIEPQTPIVQLDATTQIASDPAKSDASRASAKPVVDNVSKDISLESSLSGMKKDAPEEVKTCSGNVNDQILDDSLTTSTSTLGTGLSIVEKKDGGKMQTPSVSVDKNSFLLALGTPSLETGLIRGNTQPGKLEDQEKDHPTTEVLNSNLLTSNDARASNDTDLNNLGDLSKKEDRLDQQSEDSAPCDVIESNADLPATNEIRVNKEDTEKEGDQMQSILVDEASVLVASDSLSVPADSCSGKPVDPPNVETAGPSIEIPSNSEDLSNKEDGINQENINSAPGDAPVLKLDLPASSETCTEDVKDQALGDSNGSASTVRSPGQVDKTADETCKGEAGEEDGVKSGEMKNSCVDENLVLVAPTEAASDLLTAAGPSSSIAPTISDFVPGEQSRTNEEKKDSALDDSGLAINESSEKELVSTSSTIDPVASLFASPVNEPGNVSAEEVEEGEKLSLPMNDPENVSAEEVEGEKLSLHMNEPENEPENASVEEVDEEKLASTTNEPENASMEEVGEEKLSLTTNEHDNLSAMDVEEDKSALAMNAPESASAEEVEEEKSALPMVEPESVSEEDVKEDKSALPMNEPESASAEEVEEEKSALPMIEPENASVVVEEEKLASPVNEPENVSAVEVEEEKSASPTKDPENASKEDVEEAKLALTMKESENVSTVEVKEENSALPMNVPDNDNASSVEEAVEEKLALTMNDLNNVSAVDVEEKLTLPSNEPDNVTAVEVEEKLTLPSTEPENVSAEETEEEKLALPMNKPGNVSPEVIREDKSALPVNEPDNASAVEVEEDKSALPMNEPDSASAERVEEEKLALPMKEPENESAEEVEEKKSALPMNEIENVSAEDVEEEKEKDMNAVVDISLNSQSEVSETDKSLGEGEDATTL